MNHAARVRKFMPLLFTSMSMHSEFFLHAVFRSVKHEKLEFEKINDAAYCCLQVNSTFCHDQATNQDRLATRVGHAEPASTACAGAMVREFRFFRPQRLGTGEVRDAS